MERINWDNYNVISPYFLDRTEIQRFVALPTTLILMKYQYEIENNTLFLYRKGILWKREYFYLGFPPFIGETNTEKDLLDEVLKYIPVYLTSEEIQKYDINKRNYKTTNTLDEFLYPLNNYLSLEGKNWRKWRISLHATERDFKTTLIYSSDVNANRSYREFLHQSLYVEVKSLIEKWLTTNKNYHGVYAYVEDFFNGKLEDAVLMCLHSQQSHELKFYVITQKLSANTVFIADWKTVVKGISYNLNKAILIKSAELWKDTGENLYFNIGRAMDKGMLEAKRLLRPEMMRIYKVEAK